MMNTSSSCLINRLQALEKSGKCPQTLVKEFKSLADDAITALVATELASDKDALALAECLAPPKDFAFEGDEGIK